ncbi:MAG: extracellular solute-binding protein, partial [Lachnospiraceae bacterium]|nr:extracellular solute-binding protein [Lachnospiraceae bacterium]
TESDSNRHSYEESIKAYKAAHPDVNFTWEAIENETYKTKIKAAVAANEMPDIFFTWSCAFLGDFVKQGRVYCVDDIYATYKNELPEVMMGNVKYDGKYYGVPMTMNIVGMFANMEILKSVGYDKVPATYEELIDCCDKLVAKGIIPFGCSGKETWCVTEYLESIIEKTAGATALNEIFAGNASWNNADVSKAVGIFQEMIQKKYFDPDGIALGNDEVKNNFMNGKYAFYMNGTWNCADFAKAGLADKVQVSEFPVIDASKSQLGELIGGPSDTLAVAASSKNAKLAAESAFELAKEICHIGYLDGCGLPAWKPSYDTSSINPLTQAVSGICANASQYVLFGDTAMSAETAQIYLGYVGKIYASEIDGKAFVDGLVKDIK